jgi:cell division initiation protein
MLEKSQKKTEQLSDFFYSKDIKVILEKLGKVTLEEQG